MSKLAQIRAAIVATMATVPNLGKVQAFERYTAQQGAFRQLYTVESGEVRGWHLRRRWTRETSPALGRWHVWTGWEIRGFLSLRDEAESELAFDGLIEQLRNVFRGNDTLGGAVLGLTGAGPRGNEVKGLQLEESGPVMFAGVLCHAARLSLITHHLAQPGLEEE